MRIQPVHQRQRIVTSLQSIDQVVGACLGCVSAVAGGLAVEHNRSRILGRSEGKGAVAVKVAAVRSRITADKGNVFVVDIVGVGRSGLDYLTGDVEILPCTFVSSAPFNDETRPDETI